jgi:hypothetical protein
MDSGEVGLAGSTIQLLNTSGTVVGTATTDANGHYVFATNSNVGTNDQTQTLTLNFPDTRTNWTQSQQLAQFNPSLGHLTSIDIVNHGTIESHIRVENQDQSAATVNAQASGTLALSGPGLSVTPLSSTQLAPTDATQSFHAQAFDGNTDYTGASGHDFGTRTASGTQSVTITDPAVLAQYTGTGNVTFTATANATSSASGPGNLQSLINSTAGAQVTVRYHFTANNSLQPGNYIIQASQPSGFLPGQVTSGNVAPIPNSIGLTTIPVTLGTTDSTNNNFGAIQAASLSGFVYADLNNDGIKEPGEPGIPGSTVTLSGTDDVGDDVSLTATTHADGSYQFANLRPGNYTLKQGQPANYLDGKDTIGSQGGTVSSDQFSGINLTPGVNGVNNNFGELPPPAIASLGTPDQTTPTGGVVTKRDSLMLFWQRRGIQTTVDSL